MVTDTFDTSNTDCEEEDKAVEIHRQLMHRYEERSSMSLQLVDILSALPATSPPGRVEISLGGFDRNSEAALSSPKTPALDWNLMHTGG